MNTGIIGGADGPTSIFLSGKCTGAGNILLLYLVAVNLLTFALYGIDKAKAERGLWRISEKVLFAFPLLGGSLGAMLGMRLFRHKTRHWYFRYGIPAIFVLQTAGCFWLFMR